MTLRPAATAARIGLLLLALAGGASPSQAQLPPALPVPAKAPADLRRLEELVKAAEKAQAEGRREAAAERTEEAAVLVADWSPEALHLPETQALLARLRLIEPASSAVGEPGLKVEEEVLNLSGDELRAELERVRAAEGEAHFDFPIDLNEKVLTWVREFTTTRKGFIERSLSRGVRYLPMIRQVFAEEGIPQDLAYLPVIESGFLNNARSYAAAVGMWQFIRSTGRIYGLIYGDFIWTNLGTGVGGPVHALAVAPGGRLYVGGRFTEVEGRRGPDSPRSMRPAASCCRGIHRRIARCTRWPRPGRCWTCPLGWRRSRLPTSPWRPPAFTGSRFGTFWPMANFSSY